MSILVTGSIAYDLLLNYDGSFKEAIESADLEKLSVGFVTPRFVKHHGGTAANISWNLALLSQSPLLVGSVGYDGPAYLELLKERGVPTEKVEVLKEHATATAILATDDMERQIIFFHPGADAHGSWPDLSQDRDDFTYAIVSPRDVTLMQRALEWCKEMKVPVFFDPGQQIHAFSDDGLRRAIDGSAGVIVNEYEWSVLSERLNLTEENFQMSAPILVITRGEHGVTIFNEDGALNIGACKPDQVLNPTGAGDAFRAGFLTGLSAGWPVLHAGQLGAAMGSFVVEIEGTMLDRLDIDQVWSRMEKNYEEKIPRLS